MLKCEATKTPVKTKFSFETFLTPNTNFSLTVKRPNFVVTKQQTNEGTSFFFVGRRGRTKQKRSLALASLLGQKKRLQAEILNSNKNSGKKKADKKNISTFSRKTTGKVFTLSKKLSVLFGIHST